MNKDFIDILQKIVEDHGKEVFNDTYKFKKMLTDYTHGEYENEVRLLSKSLEAGIHNAIISTENIKLFKVSQRSKLQENFHIKRENAIWIIDVLAFLLKDDTAILNQQKAEPYIHKGKEFFDNNDLVNALDSYEKALEIIPNDPNVQYLVGLCYEMSRYTKCELSKDCNTAVEWFEKAANQQHAIAQYKLGKCYWMGDGVQNDNFKAIECYRKSAEQGYVEAQEEISMCYATGYGVPRDDDKTVEWALKAAEQGNTSSMRRLSMCYEKGWGVPLNLIKGLEWLLKAAELGDDNAVYDLCNRYYGGDKSLEKYIKTEEWLLKFALAGSSRAKFELARLYEYGNGTAQDIEKAVKWMKKAADQGHSEAKEYMQKWPYNNLFYQGATNE